jgi:monoamine oxidase
MHESSSDVLIVGAGAAGLAAASELARHGLSVRVLEARERPGGRILTLRADGVALPLELGAEFIHGTPAATFDWLRRSGQAAVDSGEQRWSLRDGRLEPGEDLFGEVRRGLAQGRRRLQRSDLSFDALLEALPPRALSGTAREFARMLVQGFDAADPAQASARATVAEWSGAAAADAPTFRPGGGYGPLVTAMAASLDPAVVDLRLGAVVERLDWRPGAVRLGGHRADRPFTVQAPRVIVTVPLGVLQRSASATTAAGPGHVHIDPPLPGLERALAQLGAGPVIKALLVFRRPFWETLDGGRYRDAAFLHVPGAPFPTFWTALPVRAPVLVAWCAGPAAARLGGQGEPALRRAALDSLQAMWGARVDVRRELAFARLHDWLADPYSRGAYSYVKVGGGGARRALSRPVAGTVFLAGEACDTGGDAGTVAGALRSGTEAARKLLRAARRAPLDTTPRRTGR